jgi:light-regulated signal transduction histidine kinase (bacteriophytochrome)
MTWAAQSGEANELKSELDRANQQLDALYYSLSHDLHSPLRTMQEMARILLEEHSQSLPPETGVFLGHLAHGTTRLVDRVDALARFGRISRVPLSLRRVEVSGLVRQLHSEWNSKAETGHTTFVSGELPDAMGDAELVRLLFSSLISNAFKFSRHAAQPRIEMGGRSEAGWNTYFITDNGAGFDMKYAGKLFGLFQRMHAEARFEGAGVGLAIARRIVERHGGTIRAEAVPDRGATFHFTLPSTDAQPWPRTS